MAYLGLCKTPYQYPVPAFKPGQSVRFEGHIYQVVAASHTHAQLEGVKFAIANWQLQKLKGKRK